MAGQMIDGKPLHWLSPGEIVEAVTRDRSRVLYDLGPRGDFIRNAALLEAFGNGSTASSTELAERYHAEAYGDYSAQFNALRIGEALLFGLRHGLVEVERTGRWRLVHSERQFEIVGSGKNERALRVHGVAGPEAVMAAKLWRREVKRRERARLRYVEKRKPEILRLIARICRQAPGTPLEGIFTKFTVGEERSIAAYRTLIENAIDDMPESEIWHLERTLKGISEQLPKDIVISRCEGAAAPSVLDDFRV